MTALADLVREPAQTVYVSGAAYLAGTLVSELPITGGSITADARRTLLRDGTLELGPTADLPAEDILAMLSVPGTEITVERGFQLVDGTRVGASLGRFIIGELSWKRTPAGETLSATIADLSERVSRSRWTDPYAIASGTGLAAALNQIIASRAPTITTAINPVNTRGTLAASAIFEAGDSSDPWADARSLASAFGYELVINTAGAAEALPAPTLDPSRSVFTFARGTTATMTDTTRVVPLRRTYSGVIVTGEGPDVASPVRGEAWDTNPGSATYCLGPFGRVPMFYSSSLITTSAQAASVAAGMLSGVLGRVQQLSWSQLVHPGLRPLDVVLVEDSSGALVPYILDAITYPLTIDGAAGAVAREIVATY